MPYEIVIGDISDLSFSVDVIVTMAHHTPGEIGNGVDRAIYRRVGERMKKERLYLVPSKDNRVIIGSAYNLKAKRLFHVWVPYYRNGKHGEQKDLRKSYDEALQMAFDYGYRSIAFPLMSSGNNGFEIRDAYRVAMHAFHEFCEKHEDMNVHLILFDEKTIAYCENQRLAIREDTSRDILKLRDAVEYPETRWETHRKIRELTKEDTQVAERIDEILEDTAEHDIYNTVSDIMDYWIHLKGLSEREICESMQISEGHFSNHLRPNKKSPPKKSPPTKPRLLVYAIAFNLNLNQTMEILNRAGYTLQPNLVFDSIVMKYITQGKYDIISLNEELERNSMVSLCAKPRNSKKTKEESSTEIKKINCHNACDNKRDRVLYTKGNAKKLTDQTTKRHRGFK